MTVDWASFALGAVATVALEAVGLWLFSAVVGRMWRG